MVDPLPAHSTIPQHPLVLTLDIGSSSTRAALYDARARLVPGTLVRRKSTFEFSPDGAVTDTAAALLERVVRCVDDVLAIAGPQAGHIATVSVATFASNLLGLDAARQPCTPIFTYADTRSALAAAALRARLDEATVLHRTGCALRTSYWPALFTWLHQSQPELFSSVRWWSSAGEWLQETFVGHAGVTYSFAAWTGLLNRHSLMWDAELLAALPVQVEQLGFLIDVDRGISGLKSPWKERWPALAHVPWLGAVGDGAAANIGSGCVGPARIALNVGTSGALRVVLLPSPEVPAGLWCYRVDRDHALLGGATSEGGNVLSWALQTLQIDAARLEAHLLDPPTSAHGLVVLPFVAGERSPGWRGDVRATISGISVATTPLDLARAALEGVTYRWAHIVDLLHGAVGGEPIIVASGGGLKHVPSWVQLIADVLGLPVAVSLEPEPTSRGLALLALRSVGAIPDLTVLAPEAGPLRLPDPERQRLHWAARQRQSALYRQLEGYAENTD